MKQAADNFMKMTKTLLFAFLFVFACSAAERLHAASGAEALLLMPDEDIGDYSAFSKELEDGGARILEAYSTNIFRGYIPKELENRLKKKYGAKVFRDRIEYMADFAPFGEIGMLSAAKWNKYVQDEPDDAPLIINMTSQKAGKKGKYLKLCWNKVPDAVFYRMQISQDESFELLSFKTATKKNCHAIMPDFWPDGVHYWRVAPVFKTVRKQTEDGEFSSPATFAVAKTAAKKKKTKPKKPLLPAKITAWRDVGWQPCEQPYYRIQVSESKNFDLPAADIFVEGCSCRMSALHVKKGGTYFMRIKSSDGTQGSQWSAPAELKYEMPQNNI